MGFRFRRSWGLIPGVRINIEKKSGSLSFGTRGFHYTVGTQGQRVTVGIPGTGLSWTQKINSPASAPSPPPAPLPRQQIPQPPISPPLARQPNFPGGGTPQPLKPLPPQAIGSGIQSPPPIQTHIFFAGMGLLCGADRHRNRRSRRSRGCVRRPDNAPRDQIRD
jgi:Protein of unknown function (DUF4236)